MSKCGLCPREMPPGEPHYSTMLNGRYIDVCLKCAGKEGTGETTSSALAPSSTSNQALEKAKDEGGTELERLEYNPEQTYTGTEAEKNVLETKQRIEEVHKNFLVIGGLLKVNLENSYYSQTGFENWIDYVESLGIKKSTAYDMVKAYTFQSVGKIPTETMLEIGIVKTRLLIGASEKGKLTPEMITEARQGTVVSLKEMTGQKIPELKQEEFIDCPGCGQRIWKPVWVKKGDSSLTT